MFDFASRVVADLTDEEERKISELLRSQALIYETGADRTAIVETEDGTLAATASLFGNVIRMVAVSPEYRDRGLSSVAISSLMEVARVRGVSHLLLFTKAETAPRFAAMGFRDLAETAHVALLESGEPGLAQYKKYLAGLRQSCRGKIGAIVMNANPFTKGHRYLIERALEACAFLYVILLEADYSFFPFADRWRMLERGIADLGRVCAVRSGVYAVSGATFPSYFLKDRAPSALAAEEAELDLRLFLSLFAPSLNITARFVGSEPESPITAIYNDAMKRILPEAGVAVCEVPRIATASGAIVSASLVRKKLEAGDVAGLEAFLPATTEIYLADVLGCRL